MSVTEAANFSSKIFFSPELTDDEKEIRRQFVIQYLYDWNAIAACLRLGFMQPFASEYARKFLHESYVQKLIREMTTAASDEDDRQSEINLIKASLKREANYHGADSSHGARVQALGRLVSIYGMETKESTVNHIHRGGVILIPAVAVNSLEWEQQVIAEQEKLLDAGYTDQS